MFRLHFRGFISILLSISFLIVVVTGFVLWLSHSPQTFGIGKGVWKHTHIFLSLLALVAGVVHFCLNWSIYWGYLWNRSAGRVNHAWEIILAVVVVGLALSTAAMDDHGGDMQRMASMSLQDIAKMAGATCDQIIAALDKEGIHVHDPGDSLKKIAEHNNVSPQAVLAIVSPHSPEGRSPR